MCTILLEPETLPAEKRSRKDSQKAVDELMARDHSFDAPFTKEELQKLFGEKRQDSICFGGNLRKQVLWSDYQLLTEPEKQLVEELGLTPEAPDANPASEEPFEQKKRRTALDLGFIPPDEDKDLPLEKSVVR